jgi:hypothetical protein
MHSLDRSRFAIGEELRRVEENGYSKVVGPNGVFAINLQTGLAAASQSGTSDKEGMEGVYREEKAGYVMDPDVHNQRVVDYFVAAGIPKDQIGGVHATTYLSSSGSLNDAQPAPPKIDGYASILERKIDNHMVVDSIAWARMSDQGRVVSGWVYWPAIPAKALIDARRLEELTSNSDFLARLPTAPPRGKVVIRHSSATEEGPFEVFASYDVFERKTSSVSGGEITVIRHFDVDGVERRLPQERRNLGEVSPKQ